MCSNFEFLKGKKEFESFSSQCLEAEKSIIVSPATCAILSRRALELAVKWVYANDSDLVLPYQDNISSLIHNESFRELIDSSMFNIIKYIVKLGNVAVHTNKPITRGEAVLALHNLHQFVSWIDYCYANEYTARDFDENELHEGDNKRTRPEELKDLYEKLSSKDRKLEELINENEELRKLRTEKRKENTENNHFKVDDISEAETRRRYIDVELKLSGWTFGKDVGIEVEIPGMPNDSGIGFADYVLYGDNGKPLAVVEAKRISVDEKKGEQQAKLYADCLEKQYGQRPIIFLSNGFNYWIWDDCGQRRAFGFYKKSELQLIIDRRTSKKNLNNIKISDDISNRYYQKEAITAVAEAFEKKQRKALLVCATGTGKTRTAISIVDVLSRHNWVKNVLFLADRKALVKQAKNNFSKLLPNLSLCNLLDRNDNPEESRMIFSTYPTMMNAIDDTKGKDGDRLFTPGHFDLIIIDESHRSIYKKYKSIFDYFDAYLIGLTATPRDEIDKNTYSIFDLENRVPTYAYEYEKAVEDGYLVDYRTIEVKSKVMEAGIKYDDLTQEEKEEYEMLFDDDESIGDEISSTVNEWLFNADTIDLVLNKLMTEGLRIEGGEKLGKTIIFAKSSRHAKAIVERFNKLYPEYGGNFAKVVEHKTPYVDTIIDDFSDKDKMPQIAVSVDMLDTGIDIPEILNLVFFKKVRSKTKFWQMIGRGTRLCPDLLGVGQDKEEFLIFDFCNNFEFFRVNPKGFEGNNVETLTEKLFNIKTALVKELQDIKYQEDEEYVNYRNDLVDELVEAVEALNEDGYLVRMHLPYVHKYKNREVWQSIGELAQNDIKEHIAPIVNSINDDELAKRFDLVMYTIQLAKLQNLGAKRGIKNVMQTAERLSKLGTIPEVKEKKAVIERVMTSEFWEEANIFDMDKVREDLRELLKYLERVNQKIYYTNFNDMIISEESNGSMYNVNDLKSYRKKVEFYLKEHQNDLAIYKLRNNKPLTEEDIKTLENVLFNELGSKSDYEKEYKETPVKVLVRKILGMDREAANEAFSEFLNNQNLNSKQIHFVKLIVDYIVKNGFIEDNRVLMEDPFRSVGSIIELFENNVTERNNLIKRINEIRKNIL